MKATTRAKMVVMCLVELRSWLPPALIPLVESVLETVVEGSDNLALDSERDRSVLLMRLRHGLGLDKSRST